MREYLIIFIGWEIQECMGNFGDDRRCFWVVLFYRAKDKPELRLAGRLEAVGLRCAGSYIY